MNETDKKLIYLMSGDLGSSLTPYADLAARLGLTEQEVISRIEYFQNNGFIRRFGATLWHQRSGYKANAMIIWRIAPEAIGAKGQELAALPYVSHCYQRRTFSGWPFNLYTMIHAETQKQLQERIEEMAAVCQSDEWRVLKSLREFKKASLRYFSHLADD